MEAGKTETFTSRAPATMANEFPCTEAKPIMGREYLCRLPQFLFNRRPLFICVFQATLIFGSLVLGWLLCFNFSLPYRQSLFLSGLLLVAVRLIALRAFDLHHGWWHFASISDAKNILKAVFSGSLAFYLLNRYLAISADFPESIYLFEAILHWLVVAFHSFCRRSIAPSCHLGEARFPFFTNPASP